MDIITPQDLASYLDDPSLVTSNRAILLVDLANSLITDSYGTATRVPTNVKVVTLEVAARAFRNPGGYSSETIDDYTYRRDADTRQAGIYLTDAEYAILRGTTARMGWLA